MNLEQWHRLNRWLQRFPPDVIQRHPDLLLGKAWALQRQARYSELFAILDGLEQTISTAHPQSTDDRFFWGEVQALKSFQYYTTARSELSATAAREALNNLPYRYHSVRGTALIFLSAALQMQGDPGQARRVVVEALQQEEGSIAIYKTMLLVSLCYTEWIAADLNSLKQTADQLLKHGQKHDLPETIVLGRFFTGILHYQRNELELAERFLAVVVGTPGTGKLVVPTVVTYCQSAFALSLTYQAMGRAEEARPDHRVGERLHAGNRQCRSPGTLPGVSGRPDAAPGTCCRSRFLGPENAPHTARTRIPFLYPPFNPAQGAPGQANGKKREPSR